MAVASSANVPAAFELKSASLTLVALLLKTADIGEFERQLDARFGSASGLFDRDPVVIDLSAVAQSEEPLDFDRLLSLLRRYTLLPLAAKGGNADQMEAARAAGLAEAPQDMTPLTPRPQPAAPRAGAQSDAIDAIDASDAVAAHDAAAAAGTAVPAAAAPAAAPAPARTLIIDKPLRSGQQVYARGGDLVVLAAVNFGAEVIADGSIHVYAPLRGRAIAGARGDDTARIFSTSMEPQLVSIAGTYRTTETPLGADVLGRPAQIRLEGDRLLVEPLKP